MYMMNNQENVQEEGNKDDYDTNIKVDSKQP